MIFRDQINDKVSERQSNHSLGHMFRSWWTGKWVRKPTLMTVHVYGVSLLTTDIIFQILLPRDGYPREQDRSGTGTRNRPGGIRIPHQELQDQSPMEHTWASLSGYTSTFIGSCLRGSDVSPTPREAPD